MKKVCIPLNHQCGSNGWELLDQVGDPGAFGEIWLACCDKECDYILKYQRYGKTVSSKGEYSSTITPEDFHREVEIQRNMASIGIAPKIADSWECGPEGEEGGAIIMEALNETLFSLMNRYGNTPKKMEILKRCIDVIHKMHLAGYYHGDLHLKNIMFKEPSLGDWHFYLIDFGLSGKLTKQTQEREKKDFDTLILRSEDVISLTTSEEKELRRYIASL